MHMSPVERLHAVDCEMGRLPVRSLPYTAAQTRQWRAERGHGSGSGGQHHTLTHTDNGSFHPAVMVEGTGGWRLNVGGQ